MSSGEGGVASWCHCDPLRSLLFRGRRNIPFLCDCLSTVIMSSPFSSIASMLLKAELHLGSPSDHCVRLGTISPWHTLALRHSFGLSCSIGRKDSHQAWLSFSQRKEELNPKLPPVAKANACNPSSQRGGLHGRVTPSASHTPQSQAAPNALLAQWCEVYTNSNSAPLQLPFNSTRNTLKGLVRLTLHHPLGAQTRDTSAFPAWEARTQKSRRGPLTQLSLCPVQLYPKSLHS